MVIMVVDDLVMNWWMQVDQHFYFELRLLVVVSYQRLVLVTVEHL